MRSGSERSQIRPRGDDGSRYRYASPRDPSHLATAHPSAAVVARDLERARRDVDADDLRQLLRARES
jgi:hypothetical protein